MEWNSFSTRSNCESEEKELCSVHLRRFVMRALVKEDGKFMYNGLLKE